MSALTIHGVTVTCDFGDKNFGNGNGRFMSLSSKLPEGTPGIPLTELDGIMADGLDMYFTAWATLMQTRYASGELNAQQFKEQIAAYRVRIENIHRLLHKLRGKSTDELIAFLEKVEKERANGQEG